MEAILSARNLDLYYGQTQALKGVSIDIPAREVTALIGPSGCGKSTFLKTLDRMNDLVPGVTITGSVQYRGKEIYAPDVDVTWLRKQIGMVFQKPNPFPMSIYDNIAYGPRTHGIRNKAKLDEIVERSLRGAAIWDEVKDRLKKSALGLSGGHLHRTRAGRGAGYPPDGRGDLRAGPNFYLKNRRFDCRFEKFLYNSNCDPQHAAGHPYLRQVRLLPAGRAYRIWRYQPALLRPEGQEDRGLHYGPFRLRRA